MEILNNLWLAVSTPNEGLLNVITIPLFFVEIYLTMSLFINMVKISSNKKQKILYVLVVSIISIITMYTTPNPFNIFINYISSIIASYFIFKKGIVKTIMAVVLSLIILNIISALLLNPYITLLNISSDELSTIPIYKLSYLLVVYTFLTISIFIFKHNNLPIHFLDDIDKRTQRIVLFNLLLGFITVIIQVITLFYYVDNLPILMTFLSFISLLTYFVISIYSLTRIFKLISTTRKLQSAEEYNHSLRVLHDSVRAFKHDFDNMVTTIGGYIKTNDMKGLEKYYAELVDDSERVNNLYILNPEVVNNDGIYNLLTKKYHETDSKDIKVNITFLLDLSTLNMKIYEFARILGILLDNAIEASSECEEKIINLIFRNDTKNHTQLLIVENTYADKTVDTEKIFEKGISGKENHTGLGLWEVRKLVNKNQNVHLRTIKDNKFFKQQLEIYYK